MHDFSKVIFFCFILLFSFSALCLDTKTKSIHYYFNGEQRTSHELIPVPPEEDVEEGCQNICSGSTPSQKPYPDCSCYCSLTHCDPGYKLENCRCVLDCLNGVDNNGDCCPPDNSLGK